MTASASLALWEAFRRIPESAPHGSNHASWLLTSAIAKLGAYRRFHVFLEENAPWKFEPPPGVDCVARRWSELSTCRGEFSALYVSGNHYKGGHNVFMLRPLYDSAPIVCEIGTSHNQWQWSSLLHAVLTGTLRESDVLVLKSRATRTVFEQAWDCWRARLGPIARPSFECRPNGVDAVENRRDDHLRAQTRVELGLAGDEVVFLAFSRLEPGTKGDQESLVALWRQVVRQAPGAVLVLSGRGPRARQLDLESMARAAGVAGRVIVLPNPYELWVDAKRRLMSAADVFVHMSTGVEETFPLTTLEGMSHGLPLIVTDWAGTRELVTDGHDGFLIPTTSAPLPAPARTAALAVRPIGEYYETLSQHVGHDGRAFVERAALLATDRERLRRMAVRARDTVLRSYRIEDVARGRIRLLERAARAASSTPPRSTLVDAQWLLDSMAARTLDANARLSIGDEAALELVPEAATPPTRDALALIVQAAQRGDCTFAAAATSVAGALVSLGLAHDDGDAVHVAARLAMRLTNYGVLHLEDPSTSIAAAPPPGSRADAPAPARGTMRRLIVEPVNGLANRLLAVVSAQRLAELTGRRLTVVWANDHPHPIHRCPGGLRDLFETDIDVCSSFEEARVARMVRFVRHPRLARLQTTAGSIELDGHIVDLGPYEAADTLAITGFNAFGLPGETLQQLSSSLTPYIRKLVAVPAVARRVQAFASAHFGRCTIGVHVRRTDFQQLLERLDLQETVDEDYFALLEECLSLRGDLTVFIASDCEETRERFRMRLGARTCIADAPCLDRGRLEGTQSALTDMLLLSRTDFVCCAPYSTFSTFARLRRGFEHGCVVPPGVRRDPRALRALAARILARVPSSDSTRADASEA
jgi:glycosyltransferase involved in cell wall biosynthesis